MLKTLFLLILPLHKKCLHGNLVQNSVYRHRDITGDATFNIIVRNLPCILRGPLVNQIVIYSGV